MKSTDYMRILKRALRPEIAVPLVYLLFILFAAISYIIPDTSRYLLAPGGHFSKPGLMSYGIALLSICILSASAFFGRRISINAKMALGGIFIVAFLTLYLTFEVHALALLGASCAFTLLMFSISKKIDDPIITWVSFSIAALASLLLLYKGIPILETVSREATAIDPSRAIFHGFAVLSAS